MLGFGPGGENSVKPGASNPSALNVLLMLILGCSIVASCKTNRELVNKIQPIGTTVALVATRLPYRRDFETAKVDPDRIEGQIVRRR